MAQLWESEVIGDAKLRPTDILLQKELETLEPELTEKARKAFETVEGGWYEEYVRTTEKLNEIRRTIIENGLLRGYTPELIDLSSLESTTVNWQIFPLLLKK